MAYGDEQVLTDNGSYMRLNNATTYSPATVVVAPIAMNLKADYYCDGVNDDVEIQQALNDAARSGGKVVLTEGIYSISATLTIGNSVILEGRSINDVNFSSLVTSTTLKRASTFDGPIITNTSTSGGNHDIVIRDLYINGDYTNGSPTTLSRGIYMTKGQRVLLFNVSIGNCMGDGCKFDGSNGGANVISHCRFRGNQQNGLLVGSGGSSDNQIISCDASSNGASGMGFTSVANCIISNNICFLNGTDGISLFNCSGMTITANRSNTNNANGIKVSGSSVGSSKNTIVGNIIYDNGQTTAGSGIQLSDSSVGGTYNVISSNVCYDSQGTPTQDYGIETKNNTNFAVITDNALLNNQTGALTTVGANNIIMNNAGYGTSSTNDALFLGTTVVIGTALSLAGTNGFLYIPTAAGTPTGAPVAQTGRVPLVYNTSQNVLYIYNGAWKAGTFA